MSETTEKANKIVKNYMWWSMGAGLIPIPFVEIPALLGVQLKMLADLSKEYNVEFSEEKGKSLIGALVGTLGTSALAGGTIGSLIKAIPLVGTVVGMLTMPVFAGALTFALGRVFIQHFEAGGNILNFDSEKLKEYFHEQFKEGQDVAKGMKENAGDAEPATKVKEAA